jgi:hypothetical protein
MTMEASMMRPLSRAPLWVAIALSAILGCNDGHGGADQGADVHVCEGDRWSSEGATTLAELADCTRITGNLSITGTDDTFMLAKLARVDGNLSIWGNATLRHVALPKLESVGGWLDIGYNELLSSVDWAALEKTNDRTVQSHWDFSVIGNPQLPACAAEALRMQLLARGFTGTIGIEDNLDSCPADASE